MSELNLNEIGCKSIKTLYNPDKEVFIKDYENKGVPCLIKEHPLNWKLFDKPLDEVSYTIGYEGYEKYLERPSPYIGDDEGKWLEQYLMNPDNELTYLSNVNIFGNVIQEEYSIPEYFRDAKIQPKEWQWLFWGPPSCGTPVHIDVDHSSAWNVCVYGCKLWFVFYKDEYYNVLQQPRDILFMPEDIPHGCVNLTNVLSITHNYKRYYGHVFVQKGKHMISSMRNVFRRNPKKGVKPGSTHDAGNREGGNNERDE